MCAGIVAVIQVNLQFELVIRGAFEEIHATVICQKLISATFLFGTYKGSLQGHNKTAENSWANLQQNAAIGDNVRRFCVHGKIVVDTIWERRERPVDGITPFASGHFVQRLMDRAGDAK